MVSALERKHFLRVVYRHCLYLLVRHAKEFQSWKYMCLQVGISISTVVLELELREGVLRYHNLLLVALLKKFNKSPMGHLWRFEPKSDPVGYYLEFDFDLPGGQVLKEYK
jgi:hypothetical protein